MNKVLFVCTGNTCRSCIAEALFKVLLSKDGKQDEFEVISAGLYAFEGAPASLQAIEVVKEHNAELKEHKAKGLTKKMINSAHIILTMTNNHKKNIINMYPESQDKVYTLKEFAYIDEEENFKKEGLDISDPFGSCIEIYKKCAQEIFLALEKVYERIKNNF